jgi:hypothetical protein
MATKLNIRLAQQYISHVGNHGCFPLSENKDDLGIFILRKKLVLACDWHNQNNSTYAGIDLEACIDYALDEGAVKLYSAMDAVTVERLYQQGSDENCRNKTIMSVNDSVTEKYARLLWKEDFRNRLAKETDKILGGFLELQRNATR